MKLFPYFLGIVALFGFAHAHTGEMAYLVIAIVFALMYVGACIEAMGDKQ